MPGPRTYQGPHRSLYLGRELRTENHTKTMSMCKILQSKASQYQIILTVSMLLVCDAGERVLFLKTEGMQQIKTA